MTESGSKETGWGSAASVLKSLAWEASPAGHVSIIKDWISGGAPAKKEGWTEIPLAKGGPARQDDAKKTAPRKEAGGAHGDASMKVPLDEAHTHYGAASTKQLSSVGLRKIENQATKDRHFTLRKSPLLNNGEVPRLIVIGDGDHQNKEVQARLRGILDNFAANQDFKKLVVELPDLTHKNLCDAMRKSGPGRDCIAAEANQAEFFSDPLGIEISTALEEASNHVMAITWAFSREIGKNHLLTNPKDPALQSHFQTGGLTARASVVQTKYLPQLEKLRKDSRIDQGKKEELTAVRRDFGSAINRYSAFLYATADERTEEMVKTVKKTVNPEYITMVVVGQAHVIDMADDLLKNVKCEIFDAAGINPTDWAAEKASWANEVAEIRTQLKANRETAQKSGGWWSW